MDRWDMMIYAVAAYIAGMALVRLMTNRRNELVSSLRNQMQRSKPTDPPSDEAPG